MSDIFTRFGIKGLTCSPYEAALFQSWLLKEPFLWEDVPNGTAARGVLLSPCHPPFHTGLTDVSWHCFPGGSLGSLSGVLF